MRLPNPMSAAALAAKIGALVLGDETRMIYGVNEIHKVEPGDLTFVDVEKYFRTSLESDASVILLNKEVPYPANKTLLVVDEPFRCYNDLIYQHRPNNRIHERIDPTAIIGDRTVIEPGVTIGPGVVIGEDGHIQANCYISAQTQIGDRVIIDAGTCIGTNGFYFKDHGTHREKWHSGGNVMIGDDVFIGSLCTINRGISGSTRIGKGTKLDSQVHLGHGVEIGEHCLIAGQSGIGGKTIIGDRVRIMGQVGITNNLVIEDDVTILAGTGVMNNLEAGKTYFGAPAAEARQRYREIVALRNLTR
ncbi:MAG: UDP-3-O-(3-hydroxymyristoyl)glucosamine N-acyltransferase [Saprospiraceae bacterium]|nr:UDP-3-O-(3-hydroxymyristoyl)glucosamine N-acyltransferase [Saprospiraceae bacterium]